ncbi:MAG: SusD/RagB family nutrient-binding outer membrane lipoprotein [Chitinophagaceae bacterium]|nr:MAG: SusD/RagB family nutrient-binding outer membrane lipoprotein [Chitinophagaceae bacterium]
MKQITKLTAVAFLATSLLSACTKNFEEINTDPNRIDAISPGTLINPIIYNVAGYNMQRADDITFNLMQVALPFPSASGGLHRYDIAENAGNGTWNTYYQWLNNIKEMYNTSVKANDPNYQAIALTLQAWIYSNLTDCFGDVPMKEAVQGDGGILHPKFDTQEEIYTTQIKNLDSANNLYLTSKSMIYGTEILYANNVSKWKKFTNSLRMRLLLRLSKKTNVNAYAQLKTMIDNPAKYPVFASNDDAAILKLTGITPLTSPWGRPIDFTTFRAAGKFFLDSLNAFNDPRRAKFATQARNAAGTANIGYVGIPSGYTGSESQFNYIPSNVNVSLVTASSSSVTPMSCVIMPYAEVEFIKAEVQFINNNGTAAKAAYEAGVKAAVEQWGAVMPTDYFTATATAAATAYNGTLHRIMLQKYYALYFVDYQAWFEYRRTGMPVLPVNTGMAGKQMPTRFKYPIAVRTNNPANYQMAVQSMGGDLNTTKVWWEK